MSMDSPAMYPIIVPYVRFCTKANHSKLSSCCMQSIFHRKPGGKHTAAARLAADRHRTALSLHDEAGERQPEAGALFRFAAVGQLRKLLKESGLLVFADSDAGIFHVEPEVV